MGNVGKLTKKQKKAQAFRDRKGKGRAKPGDPDEDNAIPLAEDQTHPEVFSLEDQTINKPEKIDDTSVVPKQRLKRKRGEEGDDNDGKSKSKSKKQEGSEAVSGGEEHEDLEGGMKKKLKQSKEDLKQRFILFVGNLRYTTSAEAVREHFKSCDPAPAVRLRTPKHPETSKPTTKSKGFAFLEFKNKAALQTALKLHHSQLEGRNINVELTAGGGGKGTDRTEKLKARNKELHEQRVKKLQKQKSQSATAKEDAEHDLRPQRYSATSGVLQVPQTKRTWTVGSTPEESEKRRKIRDKKPPRPQGTGVNAIPVG